MNNDITECIKCLQEKKMAINDINTKINEERTAFEEKIAIERKKFEETLNPLKECSTKLSNEFNTLGQNIVAIRLGDLVNELSKLSQVSVSNIGVKTEINISFCGKHNLREIAEMLDYIKMQSRWNVVFNDKSMDKQSFYYQMFFKLNLDEVQADGKTLLEHCTYEIKSDTFSDKYYTVLHIDRNIDDIILNISLRDLAIGNTDAINEGKWYPSDLIMQAVINCVSRVSEEKINSSCKKKKLSLLSLIR